eukprot:g75.t1
MGRFCLRNSSFGGNRGDKIQEETFGEAILAKNKSLSIWGYKRSSGKRLLVLFAAGYHEQYCGQNPSKKIMYRTISWLKRLCKNAKNKSFAGCRDLGEPLFHNISQYSDEGDDIMDEPDQPYNDEGDDMMDESAQSYSDEGDDMMDESEQPYSDEGDDMMDESAQSYRDEGDDMMDESEQGYSEEGDDMMDESDQSYGDEENDMTDKSEQSYDDEENDMMDESDSLHNDASEDIMYAPAAFLGAVSEAKVPKNNDIKKAQPRDKNSNSKQKNTTLIIVLVGSAGMVALVIGALVWKQRNTKNQYESYYSTIEAEAVSRSRECPNSQTEYVYENPSLITV